VAWVARVAGVSEEEAAAAFGGLAAQAHLVGEMARRIERTGRSYYAQFPAPLDLYALVRLAKPACLVESGVSSGVSSTFLLLGMRANRKGALHSIDYPVRRTRARGGDPWALPEGTDPGFAIPVPLRRGWDLHVGRSEDLLVPLLERLGRLDFYCHDSPVDVRHFEFEMKAIRRHLGPGSLVVADNSDWDTFEAAAKSVGARAVRRKSSDLGAFRVPTD
jgi:hypothetical protein